MGTGLAADRTRLVTTPIERTINGTIQIGLTKEAIKGAPEFDKDKHLVDAGHHEQLGTYYGRRRLRRPARCDARAGDLRRRRGRAVPGRGRFGDDVRGELKKRFPCGRAR